jgi:hypothetical protein
MSTTKPATTAVAIPLAQALEPTPVKPEATKPVNAKNTVVKKPVVKKAAPAKPGPKKLTATKASGTQAAVKKPPVRTPLSKAFASAKPEKVVRTAKPVKTAKAVKVEKTRKPKLVRDSFTIPKVEYVVLEALKQRATRLTRSVKKSELLRAGIKALAALSDAAFLKALEQVPAIKTGRPAAEK